MIMPHQQWGDKYIIITTLTFDLSLVAMVKINSVSWSPASPKAGAAHIVDPGLGWGISEYALSQCFSGMEQDLE